MTSLSQGDKVSKAEALSSLFQEENANEDSHSVFIGNIPTCADRASVKHYLKGFCRLKHLSFPIDVRTGKHKGFAKAFFYSEEDLQCIVTYPLEHYLLGVPIVIKKWVPRRCFSTKKELPTPNKIFFRMAQPFLYSELWEIFSNYGTVSFIDLKRDRLTDEVKDYGFVTFQHENSALCLLSDGKNRLKVGGKVLTISESKSNKQISAEIKAKKRADHKALDRTFSGHHPILTQQRHGYDTLNIENFRDLTPGIQQYPFTELRSGKGKVLEKQINQKPSDSQVERDREHWRKPFSIFWDHNRVYDNHTDGTNLFFRIQNL